MLWMSSVVLAQVNVTPSSSGLPGAQLIQEMIDWLGQIALWGRWRASCWGPAIYGLAQQSGNYAGGYRGKQLALGGVVGRVLPESRRPRSTCCSKRRTDEGPNATSSVRTCLRRLRGVCRRDGRPRTGQRDGDLERPTRRHSNLQSAPNDPTGPGPRGRTPTAYRPGSHRSQQGATAAAAAYVLTGQVLLGLPTTTLDEAVRAISSTASASVQVSTIAAATRPAARRARSRPPVRPGTCRPCSRRAWTPSHRTAPRCRYGVSECYPG